MQKSSTLPCVGTAVIALASLICFVTTYPICVHANGIPSPEAFKSKTPEELAAVTETESTIRKKSKGRRTSAEEIELSEPILASYFNNVPGFYHGVASGDPLPDAIILWTRYTPESSSEDVTLELRIAEVDPTTSINSLLDPDAPNSNMKVATVTIGKSSDFVAKLDVKGLKSNTNYVYAFTDGIVVSDVGQTRTAPAPNDDVGEMIYAFFSCAQVSNGYFHSYDVASTIKDIDFWIHVGDYIYENGAYASIGSDSPERIAKMLVSVIYYSASTNKYSTLVFSHRHCSFCSILKFYVLFTISRNGRLLIYRIIEIDTQVTTIWMKVFVTFVAVHL